MALKTFRGRTMEMARKAAESEMGKDCVVVATRKVEKPTMLGFFTSAEFEISVETAPAAAATSPGHRLLKPTTPANPFALEARVVRVEGAAQDMQSLREDVRNELRTLRALFTRPSHVDSADSMKPFARELEADIFELHEMLADLHADREREPSAQLKRILASAGIEGQSARTIARRVRERGDEETVVESFKAVLCDLVRTAAFPLTSQGRTLISLVGPTGVGKTTTAAKLAAHAILEQGRSVTLISCDSFRVGAVQQLERFANILGADFRSVKTRHGLEEALHSTSADVTIIDTAGRPGGRDDIEGSLHRAGDRTGIAVRHTLLCVPAALREVDARRFAKVFAPSHANGLAITKLDETPAPSGLVHAPLAAKLPITVLCFGQRVPEDIAPAHPKTILEAMSSSAKKAPPARPAVS